MSIAPAFSSTVVISNERSGDLLFMNESGEMTEVMSLCGRPRGMAQNTQHNALYIACSDDGVVIEIDLKSKKHRRVFADVPGALSIAIHAKSGRMVVTNEGHAKATVIDLVSGNVLATLSTGLEPDGVALSSDGSLIFVATENAGLVHVFDGNSYKLIKNIITNLRPRRLAIRESELWISSEMGSRVEIFDTASFLKIDEIIFSPRGFRSEQLTPVDIIFNKSQTIGFVALGSANHVAFIDAATREILKYILVGRRPWGLALTDDGNTLFVLNGLSDDVTIVDVASRRPIRTRRTGLVPHSVEIFH